MIKDSFILYTSFYEPIKDLSNEQKGILLTAIFEYQMGNEPDIEDGMVLMAFRFMRNQFELDKRKYAEKVEKNRENGKLGGAPTGNNNRNNQTVENQPKTSERLKINPNDNDNDNDNDNENDNENDNDKGNVNDNEKDKSGAKAPPFVFSENLSQKSPSPPETPAPSAKHDTSLHDPPPDQPAKTKDDAITVWNKARDFWNSLGLKPECRDLMMRNSDTSEILQTFQHYTWTEIKNAIDNYDWHKSRAGPKYKTPPPYGSLAGFLKTGVSKYFDDDALDDQFLEDRK